MAEIIEITELDAEGVQIYSKLTETQLRNRLEPEKGIFIAESVKVIKLALDAGYTPVSLLSERRHIAGSAKDIIERVGNIPVYTADDDVLEALSGYRLSRGVLCAMKRPAPSDWKSICENARRIAVLEDITDSTNVGAVFRSAAALGIDALLLSPSCCDPLCRRSVRVSMGTVLLEPWAYIGGWHENGAEQFHEKGFKTAALTLNDNSVSIDEPRLRSEKKLALVLGTEGDGLARDTIESCDYSVKIPMLHGVDSLNVAAAGAVAFWELRAR